MSASSSQQSKNRPAKRVIKGLKVAPEVSKTKADEGEDSKLGTSTIKNSSTSHVLQNSEDEVRSKFVQSVAEIIEKIAKESQDRTVTLKKSEFQQEVQKKLTELVRFGPFYGVDSDPIKQAKKDAWKHIVEKGGSDDDIKRTYKLSLKDVEDGAMEIYDIPIKDKPKPERFRRMMVKDGCFFLQLALHILGGADLLKYPSDHLYFGKHVNSAIWIPHMFFIGNQIPYDVLQVLMKQTFFKDLINEGIQRRTWYSPDETNIEKMALYLTVVKPAFWSRISEQPPPHFREPPSNVLECLHNLFLGNRARESEDFKIKEFERLEAGTSDSDIKIPSAGELSKSGIKLAANKTPGIKNICFRNLFYCAKIYLPVLTIRSHTKDILANLVIREQDLNDSDREVTAYLRFMRDLVRTYDDLKILEEKKIIIVEDKRLRDKVIRILDDLVTIHSSNFTLNFRHIRQKIKDYGGPPWRLISIILGVLTIIQTIFTVLSYILPPK